MKKILKVLTSSALTMALLAGTAAGLGSTSASAAQEGANNSNVVKINGDEMYNDYIKLVVDSDNYRFVLGTTGGNPDSDTDDEQKLLYGFPFSSLWSSKSTVVVDSSVYLYGADSSGLTQKPEYSEAERRSISSGTYGNVKVDQVLTLVNNVSTNRADVLEVRYIATNTDTVKHDVGIRIMFDTMLGDNDEAPFRVAGYGTVTTETTFKGDEIPQYWQAFDSLENPKVISQGSFLRDGDNSNNPDMVQFCNWRRVDDNLWGYETVEGTENGDSAVTVTWLKKELAPGESRVYTTYYGLSELTQNVAPPLSLSVYGDTIVTQKGNDKTTEAPIYNNVAVTAYVQNVSDESATNSYAKLVLPRGMSVVGGTAVKSLGTIEKGKTEQITWDVKIAGNISAGDYTLKVLCGCDETTEKAVERKITVPQVLTNKSSVASTDITLGEKINITADAEGGFGSGYLYAMYYRRSGVKTWSKLGDYSTITTGSIKPQKTMPYEILVKVKDGNGSIADKYITVNVYDPLTGKSSVSADEINLGQSVTMNGAAEGGSGSFNYAYYYKLADSDKWTTLKKLSSDASAVFTPDAAKVYDLKVVVKDTKTGKKASNEFKLDVKDPLKNTSSISAKVIVKGKTVTVTASAKGGQPDYTYAVFYKKSTDTKWTTKQSFKANETVVIEPKAAVKYNICVKAKDSQGNIDKKYFTVTVNKPLENKSTVSADTIVIGDSVKVNAAAAGGMGGYEYAVFYKKATDTKWTTKQKFSTNAVVDITPKAATNYRICVKVKDKSGEIEKKYFDLKVNKKLANNSTLSAERITLGSSVTVKCAAAGGMGDYQYAVLYKKASGTKWTTVQSYNTNKTVKVTPKVATNYRICVKVKDASGKIEKKYFDIEVTKALQNTSTITVGDKITLNGSASNANGDCTYAFCYKKTADTKWTFAQNFASNNTLTVSPEKGVSYDYCIKVKDTSGSVVKKYFSITIN